MISTVWIIVFSILGLVILSSLAMLFTAIGWGISSRPGCIPMFNVVTEKTVWIRPGSIKTNGIAGFCEVQTASFFGITRKADTVPVPKVIKVNGKPILALTPYKEASMLFKESFRIDYMELQKVKLERAEFERKYHQEVNKTIHEIDKRVENDLKRVGDIMPTFMKPKSKTNSGGNNYGNQNRN